jgi:hypothetical protein
MVDYSMFAEKRVYHPAHKDKTVYVFNRRIYYSAHMCKLFYDYRKKKQFIILPVMVDCSMI